MLQLLVKGVRGVAFDELRLEYGQITRFKAPNCTGKTSTSAALAALLSRNTDPLGFGIQKQRMYIHAGLDADEVSAKLTEFTVDFDEVWSITWHVGAQTFDVVGPAPKPIPLIMATPKSLLGDLQLKAGFVDAMFTDSIGRDELVERLSQIISETKDVASAMSLADQILSSPTGWEETMAVAQDNCTSAKRSWQHAVAKDKVHEEYGSAKAAVWLPSRWEPAYSSMTTETVDREIYNLSSQLEHAEDVVRDLKNQQEVSMKYEQDKQERNRLSMQLQDLRGKVVEEDSPGHAERNAATAKQMVANKADERRAEKEYLDTLDVRLERQDVLTAEIAADRDLIVNIEHKGEKELADLRATLEHERGILSKLKGPQAPDKCALCGQDVPPDPEKNRAAIQTADVTIRDLEDRLSATESEHGSALKRLQTKIDETTAKLLSDDEIEDIRTKQGLSRALLKTIEDALSDLQDKATKAQAVATLVANSRTFADQADAISETIASLDRVLSQSVAEGPTNQEVEDAQRDVDRLRAAIRNQEHIKDMLAIIEEARAAHHIVCAWERILHFVGPKGIRLEKIEAGMKKLDTTLKNIGKHVDLNGVTVKNSKIQVGARDIHVVAGSEQWFASAVVRVAMAIVKDVKIAVIDGADVLDKPRREQAFNVLRAVAHNHGVAVLWTETEA